MLSLLIADWHTPKMTIDHTSQTAVFVNLTAQIKQLKKIVLHQKKIIHKQDHEIEQLCSTHYAIINEMRAEHDATKEKLQQTIKKDEMKTALIKQLMQK